MSDDETTGSGVFYWGSSGTGVDVNVTLADGQQRHVHVERGGELPGILGGADPRPVSVRTIEGLLATSEWSRSSTADEHAKSLVAAEPVEPLALTDAEAASIAAGIEAGDLLGDEDFAAWMTATNIADILAAVGSDVAFAKRALLVEHWRGSDARKGLVASLVKLTTGTE